MSNTTRPTGFSNWIRRFRRNIPYLMVAISVAFLGLFVWLGYDAFLGPVLGAAFGSILALGIKSTEIQFPTDPIDWRFGTIVTSGYVVGTIAAYRNVFYTRPLVHYVLLGCICAFIAYQIWIGQPRRHVFPQLGIAAFMTYWSSHFAYPGGVITPDGGFISLSQQIATMGIVPAGATYQQTPGHMIYAAEGILLTGMSQTITYQLLSVIALLTAVCLVALLNDVIPGIDRRIALFSALIFAMFEFTLRRGFFPDKTNFFKPSILFLIFVVFYIIYQDIYHRELIICAVFCTATLVFGHTYSMAAAMIVTGPIWGYHQLTILLRDLDYRSFVSRGTTTGLIAIVILSIFGYSISGGTDILSNVSQLIVTLATLFEPTTRGAAGTQVSSFSWSVFFFSTGSQIVFFALSVAGVSVAVRQRDWSLDAVLAWVLFGIGFLGFSLFFEAITIPTPRIYLLLGIFGLNIMAAIGLIRFAQQIPTTPRGSVVTIVFVLVVLSLASPVSSVALSPIADELPGKWRTQTTADTAQQTWAGSHTDDRLLVTRSTSTDLPLQRTGAKTATVDYKNISSGTTYEYREIAERRGVKFGGGSARVGGATTLFLHLPVESNKDSKIYTNHASSVYLHGNWTSSRNTISTESIGV